jgi:hypothetical protein
MAEHLISEGFLEVISNRSAGDGRSPGPPRLPDFQGHFHAHEGEPGRLDVADARDAVEVEEFSTEYEAFGRARELLENGDHGGVSARDSSGNVLCGVRLQLKFGFFGE